VPGDRDRAPAIDQMAGMRRLSLGAPAGFTPGVAHDDSPPTTADVLSGGVARAEVVERGGQVGAHVPARL
jgi:hypothetical protein